MPAAEVGAQIADRSPSIALVRELSERYGTSLLSTALRVRELSTGALCLVYVAAGRVKWCWPTSRFQWRCARGASWPLQQVPSLEGEPFPTLTVFGPEAHARVGAQLIVSAADMPHYDASLWMLVTRDSRRPWEWGELDAELS